MRFGMAEQQGIPKKGQWVTITHYIGYYNVAILKCDEVCHNCLLYFPEVKYVMCAVQVTIVINYSCFWSLDICLLVLYIQPF